MKITSVEIDSINTWYSVEVENDSQKAISEGNYSICDMYDSNSDYHTYEITPEPATKEDRALLIEAITK